MPSDKLKQPSRFGNAMTRALEEAVLAFKLSEGEKEAYRTFASSLAHTEVLKEMRKARALLKSLPMWPLHPLSVLVSSLGDAGEVGCKVLRPDPRKGQVKYLGVFRVCSKENFGDFVVDGQHMDGPAAPSQPLMTESEARDMLLRSVGLK